MHGHSILVYNMRILLLLVQRLRHTVTIRSQISSGGSEGVKRGGGGGGTGGDLPLPPNLIIKLHSRDVARCSFFR